MATFLQLGTPLLNTGINITYSQNRQAKKYTQRTIDAQGSLKYKSHVTAWGIFFDPSAAILRDVTRNETVQTEVIQCHHIVIQ